MAGSIAADMWVSLRCEIYHGMGIICVLPQKQFSGCL